MKKEKLLRLWFLQLINKLSPADELELNQWRNESPHHEDLMRWALNPRRIRRSQESDQIFDEEKAWKCFADKRATLHSRKKASIWQHPILCYTAAASILLLLSVTCFWALYHTASESTNPTEAPQIYAACEGVTLSYQGQTQQIEHTQYNVEDTTIITLPPAEIKEELPLTINVAKGNSFKLILDDSTEVYLNSCTQIVFPRHFHGNCREITLPYGEAFFKVTKHPGRPFIIHTASSTIRVLGTTFNVNAYANEHLVATTLIEGSVAFCSKNNENFILQPGMQSCMDTETGETNIEKVDTSIYTAWLHDEFIFQSIDLPGIMRQIERWYDIETDFPNFDISKYHFKGTFNRDLSLQQILEILSDATGLKFTIEGKRIKITK